MRRIALLAIAAGFVVPLMAPAPAHAQATRTWVSGVGDDANPCSRTAPCKTFAGAISKTATAGIINCIDSGGFGGVTIIKSITIDCRPFLGGVLAGATNAINVNVAGGTVILRGLDIEGATGVGLVGVNIIAAATVHIQQCFIYQFQGGSAAGVKIATTSGNPEVMISDTYIHDNGTGGTGGGVLSQGSGGFPFVTLYNVRINNNVQGVQNNSVSRMRIANSMFSSNTVGIEVDAGGVVALANSDLNFNGTAISGATLSHGNNRIAGNIADGTAPTAAGPASTDLGQK
jgi:hypothetical protein